jgi:membrane dipeptidase
MQPISRRDFAALTATGALGATGGWLGDALHVRARATDPLTPLDPATPTRHGAWPGYDAAIVIDNLATPGPFNVPNSTAAPYSAAMIANARASGITAVNVTLSGGGPTGSAAFESTVRNLAFLERELDAHPDALARIRTVADIRRAKAERRVGLIAGFQDTTMLEGDVSRVDLFHGLGVRIIQLTYNVRNLVGDGCLEPGNAGLSAFGREVVTRMATLGILVDVSHCGRRTTDDAIAYATRPIAATHTSCAALADVPRAKTDDQLRRLAAKGGVAGMYMMPFLRLSGQPTGDDFIRHLEHAVNVMGEDHVGVGSDNSITPLELTPAFRALHADFVRQRRAQGISAPGEDEQVFNHVPDLDHPRRMERIADRLAARGHSSARIEKILGGNWLRLFGETWR